MKYTKEIAISKIKEKRGVRVLEDGMTKQIDFSDSKDRIGNKTWGIVDYLKKEHKFMVTRFPPTPKEEN